MGGFNVMAAQFTVKAKRNFKYSCIEPLVNLIKLFYFPMYKNIRPKQFNLFCLCIQCSRIKMMIGQIKINVELSQITTCGFQPTVLNYMLVSNQSWKIRKSLSSFWWIINQIRLNCRKHSNCFLWAKWTVWTQERWTTETMFPEWNSLKALYPSIMHCSLT